MTLLASAASRRRLYWRAFWGAMWMAHLPGTWQTVANLFGAGDGPPDWGRFLLLSASNIFFLIEICFAPSLRLVANRRALVVFLLIIAIMHSGMIEQSVPGLIFVRGANLWLLLTVSVACLLQGLIRAAQAVAAQRRTVDFLAALWKTTRCRFHSTIDRGRRILSPAACFLVAPPLAPPSVSPSA